MNFTDKNDISRYASGTSLSPITNPRRIVYYVILRVLSFFSAVFIFQFICMVPAMSEPTSYLPNTHRAYEFLELMEHKVNMPETHLGTKPVTRREIARLLFGCANKKSEMTDVEREELNCLLDEFSADFISRQELFWEDMKPVEKLPFFLQDYFYRNRRNMYSIRDYGYSLYLDPVIVQKAKLGSLHGISKDDNVYTSSHGFILRGTVGERLGFHIDVRDSKEWGSRNYPENTDTTMPGRGFASFKGDHAEFDETYAHIAYSNGPFVVSYSRDKNVWGHGRHDRLIMSGYGSPYDIFRIETVFGALKFVFFTAEIKQFPPIAKFYYTSPPDVPSDSVTVKKYLSGHRIELALGNRLNLGFHETVVYGGRWEWSYINPVMFLKGAEHANGDHDNAAMGMDFRLFVRRSHSLYGELLIDDITTTKLGTGWYGNKLAYRTGFFLVEPFGLENTDTRIEYTRIDPWVYTHQFPINSYTHYGDVLGNRLGPNSDEMSVTIRKRFTRRFHTELSFIRQRHGANIVENEVVVKNVGGDPLEGFKPGDSKKARFLAGNLEKTTAAGIDVSYEIAWQLFMRLGYTYETYNGDGVNIFRFSLDLNE